jgi:hypothetical protein
MRHTRLLKTAAVVTAFAVIVLAGTVNGSKRVAARDDQSSDRKEESRIQRGFEIAPVSLNLQGKNRALVGLGSYIVNAVGDCNGCHSAGPQTEFVPGGNPYQLSPPFSWKNTDKYGELFGRRAGFWPLRVTSAPLFAQFDTGQNGVACRRAQLRGVRRDHAGRHRFRSRTSELHRSRHSSQLPRGTI